MNQAVTLSPALLEERSFITQVYMWMAGGLGLTALVAMYVASQTKLVGLIANNPLIFFGLIIAEVIVVIYLSATIKSISVSAAMVAFFAYAALNGLTFSILFLIYTTTSVSYTFFLTAGLFGIMSFYGYVTKTDLTTVGNISLMALLGLILASVVNIFLNNNIIYWITTYAGIIIFVALTAYDTQKIKKLNIIGNANTDEDKKEAIMGALTLYLDFINLFLFLLRIFGRRK